MLNLMHPLSCWLMMVLLVEKVELDGMLYLMYLTRLLLA